MTDFIPEFQDSPALHEFRLKLSQEFARLYAEIDRKNLTIKALTEERDEVGRMANKFTAERDEARRIACEKEERLGCDESGCPKNGSAREHANRRGWECFNEKTS